MIHKRSRRSFRKYASYEKISLERPLSLNVFRFFFIAYSYRATL